jgi:DNA invertase Pin-like site-specific DNA recombinase
MTTNYGYARVSSDGQDYEGQLEKLRRFGIPEENIYKEKMSGSTTDNRTEYHKLMKRIETEPGVVHVSDLTRWSRSTLDGLMSANYLREHDSSLKTLDGTLDTRALVGPIGEAMFQIMFVLAEIDRKTIALRLKAGRDRERAKAGYKEGRKAKFTDAQVDELREMYLMGSGPTELARDYGVSVSTMRRALGLNNESSTYDKAGDNS